MLYFFSCLCFLALSIISTLIKQQARPIPRADYNTQQQKQYFRPQFRESLECSATSSESCLTDISSPNWQFNNCINSSSTPRSTLISLNGIKKKNNFGGEGQQLLKILSSSNNKNKNSSSSHQNKHQLFEERSVVRVSPPAPIQRREVVRREVIKAPTTKHTVHRIEEKKRTEEVERRVVRRERRHKSRRVHRGYHSSGVASGGHDYHYGSWGGRGGGGWGSGGGGGYRSRSASRRSGYANGYSDGFGERHLPISYEGGGRRSGGFDSERHFAAQNGHARYGSVTDSLRRGDTKYMPNGELKINGTGTLKHHRVHKAHSTRDVYHHDEGADTGSRHSFYQHREPFIEFPPSIDRRSEWSVPPEPPSHRRHAIDEFRGGQLTKARSFADWGEEGRGRSVFGSRGYDEDMARLENEFRDARLMRIPSGNMYEKQHHHREIPGGYETYEREVKAHSDRKLDGGGGGGFGTPNNGELRSRDVSQVSVKHESGLPPK